MNYIYFVIIMFTLLLDVHVETNHIIQGQCATLLVARADTLQFCTENGK